ncbi:MAG TPA: corrinoid protein [Capsulimonadaceae bacterium]|jgi:5-methyltetrahydrofolate--homocysteine methyltransferase
MTDFKKLTDAIKAGSRVEAVRLTSKAIADGEDLNSILSALIAGMDDVGRKFKANEIFVPEVLIAARAMKEGLAVLEPMLLAAGIAPEFTAVIGTVQGDLHDIGKNLVAMMLRGANFNVIDLGTNVPVDRFVSAAKQHNANVVGLSALLTTTMPAMKTAVDAIRGAGITAKILIGGAPITSEFAAQIGADGFAPDAASAVDVARRLVAA